jgi:hypothetical protein
VEQPPEGTPEKLSEYLTRYLNSLILSVNSLKDTVRLWNKDGFTGTFIGNVTGNLTGNVTGNLTGNVTGNVTGNLTTSGNVTCDVVIARGLLFPATQVPSTDVNCLDDYEEGTWTPTLSGFTFVGTNNSTYYYIKIGKLVVVNIYLTAVTSVAFTAAASITLPFNQGTGGNASGTLAGTASIPFVLVNNTVRPLAIGPAQSGYVMSVSYIASA